MSENMIKRKNCAVIMSQPESPFQVELMKGINEEAFSRGYNTILISSLVKVGGTYEFNLGEKQIYKLIESECIDGFIVVPDLLQLDGIADYVNSVLDKASVPVVYINSDEANMLSSHENSDEDFEMLTDHLYQVHNCRKFAVMLGPIEHEHSVSRRKSIEKAFAKRDIVLDESNVYYGDFWYNEGENTANAIIEKNDMPDAVICISDAMAISLKNAFEKRGIKVPEDIIVVGYDSTVSGANELYSVTSVEVNSASLGRDAICKLASRLENDYKYVPESQKGKLILSDTCGCSTNVEKHLVATRNIPHCAYDESDSFYSGYNFMNEYIVNALDLRDLLWKINYYRMYFPNVKNLSLCLCEFMSQLKDGIDISGDTRGYSDKIFNSLDNSAEDIVDEGREFELKKLYPKLNEPTSEPPCSFYFAPLHFNDTTFGYVIIEIDNPLQPVPDCFSQWIRNCTVALESLKRQLSLKIMYHKFEESTVKDLSTGLFSRNGFNLYSPDMLKKASNQQVKFTFILGDLNCLKHINDVYGHAAGDKVIKKAAEIFSRDIKGDNIYEQKNFRIGGDEFVKIVIGDITKEQTNFFLDETRNYLGKFNDSGAMQYPVYLSMGYYCEIPSSMQSIGVILTEADKLMFEDKKRMKSETGFDFKRD